MSLPRALLLGSALEPTTSIEALLHLLQVLDAIDHEECRGA